MEIPLPPEAFAEKPAADFFVQVYVKHGYYEYTVGSAEQAVAHAEAIMSNRTYRRSVPGGMEVHAVFKVKVKGPELESQYNDRFRRT